MTATCERCRRPMDPGPSTKRYCSARCRKRAERARAARRRQSGLPPRERAPRVRATACKDCGTVDGMGWWVGRMKHPGSAGPRCHPCYLAYTRRRQTPRPSTRGGAQ